MNGIMFHDLEVENHEYYGAIASPRHPDNYVVMSGQALDYGEPYSGEVTYEHYKNKEEAVNWLKIPDDVWLYVAHNASFEIDWMYTQCFEELAKFIKRGGRIWCTQLAEYRLSRQEWRYPALSEVAVTRGGNEKLDLVSLEWQRGKLTSEIDPDMLRDYLVGTPDSEGDIGNTRLVFYSQWQEAQERGMLEAILNQTDGLLYNAVCMANGLKIDTDVAQHNLNRLENRISEVETMLEDVRRKEGMPECAVEAFKMGSDFHKSALIYGGTYAYDARVESVDAKGNLRYEKQSIIRNLNDLEDFIVVPEEFKDDADTYYNNHNHGREGTDFEPERFKAGKRKGQVKAVRVDSDRPKMINGRKFVVLPGLIDIESYPEEFKEGWLSKYQQNRTLTDGRAVLSSSEDAIVELMVHKNTPDKAKEVLALFQEWAILNKVIGAFFDRTEYYANGNLKRRSGVIQYVTEDGLIHHNLNITATKTGRLSSTRPNLQQIPRDDREGVMKSNVKEMFVSRFGDDGLIVEIDYNALEVRAMADFAGDENLKKFILDNVDMHSLRASTFHGLSYEEVEQGRKDPNNPKAGWYNQIRQDIKAPSFAYQYGASAHGIAYATGWSVEDSQKFIENEQRLFPDLERYFEGIAERIDKTKRMQRYALGDGTYDVYYTGYLKAPSGFEYSYRSYRRTVYGSGEPCEIDEFKPTEMRNYIIQGDSSLFVQVSTGKVIRHIFNKDFYGMKCIPINTVHDQVLLDVHKDVAKEVIKEVCDILERIPEHMKPLGYDLTLPYPVEATAGANWQDQLSLEEVFDV